MVTVRHASSRIKPHLHLVKSTKLPRNAETKLDEINTCIRILSAGHMIAIFNQILHSTLNNKWKSSPFLNLDLGSFQESCMIFVLFMQYFRQFIVLILSMF